MRVNGGAFSRLISGGAKNDNILVNIIPHKKIQHWSQILTQKNVLCDPKIGKTVKVLNYCDVTVGHFFLSLSLSLFLSLPRFIRAIALNYMTCHRRGTYATIINLLANMHHLTKKLPCISPCYLTHTIV